jgi:hypothetical protein
LSTTDNISKTLIVNEASEDIMKALKENFVVQNTLSTTVTQIAAKLFILL